LPYFAIASSTASAQNAVSIEIDKHYASAGCGSRSSLCAQHAGLDERAFQ